MESLTFRLVCKKDAADLLGIWGDIDVTRYTMIHNIGSKLDCESRIERQLKWVDCDSIGPFVIIDDNALIGYCGGTRKDQNAYEIFYHISKIRWNKGLGTKIVKEILNIGFTEKNANKIIAKAVSENTGSWKVLEKNGMRRTRIETEGFEKGGEKHDLYVYEINRDAWLSSCRLVTNCVSA